MKKSLRIFQLLVGLMLLINVASTAHAIYKGDTASAISTASITLLAAPVMGASALTVKHKDSEWKKSGPVAFIVIQMPGNNIPKLNPYVNTAITEGYSNNSLPAPGGAGGGSNAIGSSGTSSSMSEQIFADFSLGRALSFQMTIGTTYAGGVIPLIPQYFNDALPTGVTFSSSAAQFGSFQAFVNYFVKFPTLFSKLVATVDDTAQFDKDLILTRTNPDGTPESLTATWNRLAIDPYAQVQTLRTIQKNFFSGTDMRYEFKSVIPGSGTKVWTFVFDIARVGNTVNTILPRS